MHRLLTLIAAASLCATAAAQERIAPTGSTTSSTRAAPSESMRANSASPEAATAAPRARGMGLTMPAGTGSFGGVSSTTSPTLEGAVGSGARSPGSNTMRKVCPPGLENRDGNCAPPITGIMRP